MKKLLSITFILIITVGLTACEKPNFLQKEESKDKGEELIYKKNKEKNIIVGGDKDEHGCIGSAGYTWNENKQECTRSWEEKEKEKNEDKPKEMEESKTKDFSELIKEEIKKCEDKDGEWNKMSKTCNDKDEEGIREDKEDAEEEAREGVILAQQTLLILDASGSMWGQIEGETKISIAKDVVKKTVKNFENTELGLMAYGHRRKGDCKDIEILTAPKKDNAENISKMVDGISPKGMTPMGNSVLMAAESLKYTEQKATVILVSDGIETCEINLCELGKKLEETGVDFTAHVIGFDMTEEQTAGLKCLADETGGTFTSAKNADDLGKALEKTVEASSCSKEKLGEAIITAPAEVEAGSKFEVEFTGPKNENDNISIMPKDSTDGNKHLDYFYTKNDSELKAPIEAGEYDIVYFADCGEILGRTSIIVKKVFASITAPKEVNAGSTFEIKFTGPQNSGDFIAVVPTGSTNSNEHLDYFYSKNTPNLEAPMEVGSYDIVYFANGEKELARTTFKSLEVSASIVAPEEVGAGSEFKVEFTGPKNSGDFIAVVPIGSTNSNEHLDYFYPESGTPELNAPLDTGKYDIVYFAGGEKELARTNFEAIEVGANITLPEEVGAGSEFKIEFIGPKNNGDFIAVVPKGSTNSNEHLDYFYPESGTPELNAPEEAGEYDIIYWLKGKKELARTTFTVINK